MASLLAGVGQLSQLAKLWSEVRNYGMTMKLGIATLIAVKYDVASNEEKFQSRG